MESYRDQRMSSSDIMAATVTQQHGVAIRRAIDATFGKELPSDDQDWMVSTITPELVADRAHEIWSRLPDDVKLAMLKWVLEPQETRRPSSIQSIRKVSSKMDKHWVIYCTQSIFSKVLQSALTADEAPSGTDMTRLIDPYYTGPLGVAILADAQRMKAGYVSERVGNSDIKTLIDRLV